MTRPPSRSPASYQQLMAECGFSLRAFVAIAAAHTLEEAHVYAQERIPALERVCGRGGGDQQPRQRARRKQPRYHGGARPPRNDQSAASVATSVPRRV